MVRTESVGQSSGVAVVVLSGLQEHKNVIIAAKSTVRIGMVLIV